MICNKLIFFFLWHWAKGIEGSSEVSLESLASFGDFVHDFNSLFVCDAWGKWIAFQVTTNSNTSWDNHSLFVSWEWWADKLWSVHVWSVFSWWSMLVVSFDDLIKEFVEDLVGAVGASVASDSGVDVLSTWDDAGLEWNSKVILFVLVLFPNLLSSELAGKWLLVVGGPDWEVS